MADWADITAAVQLALTGDRVAGRLDLMRCWDSLGHPQPGQAAQRCVLAHYLADLETDVDDEVRWDERALAAYGDVGAHDLQAVGIPDAAGLAPSLHLNLGDGYRRLGRTPEARRELAAGLATAGSLDGDGYGAMIRSGLLRLADRLDEAPPPPVVSEAPD